MSDYETAGERLRRQRAEKRARGEWAANEEPYVPSHGGIGRTSMALRTPYRVQSRKTPTWTPS